DHPIRLHAPRSSATVSFGRYAPSAAIPHSPRLGGRCAAGAGADALHPRAVRRLAGRSSPSISGRNTGNYLTSLTEVAGIGIAPAPARDGRVAGVELACEDRDALPRRAGR